MSTAIQPNMRNPNISVNPFLNIINDYSLKDRLKDLKILDIGPGQCDFLDIAKNLGAETIGIDFDPAVKSLGELRGHKIHLHKFTMGWPLGNMKFDGIFCRGSLNFYSFLTTHNLENFLSGMSESLSDNAWLWIAPWNKPSLNSLPIFLVENIIDEFAKKNKVDITKPSLELTQKYGIGYKIPKIELWTR